MKEDRRVVLGGDALWISSTVILSSSILWSPWECAAARIMTPEIFRAHGGGDGVVRNMRKADVQHTSRFVVTVFRSCSHVSSRAASLTMSFSSASKQISDVLEKYLDSNG